MNPIIAFCLPTCIALYVEWSTAAVPTRKPTICFLSTDHVERCIDGEATVMMNLHLIVLTTSTV